jgi:hypothetical protein
VASDDDAVRANVEGLVSRCRSSAASATVELGRTTEGLGLDNVIRGQLRTRTPVMSDERVNDA